MSSFTHPRILSFALLAFLLAACGGGGGNGDGGNQDKTVVLPVNLAFTGTLTPLSYTDTSSDGIVVVGDYVVAGTDFDVRGFLSFDFTGLPAGAAIVSATVRLSGRIGIGSPYTKFGLPLVSPVDMGPSVSADDFDSIHGSFLGTFPTWTAGAFQPGVIEGPALTEAVRLDFLANRPRTSLRLHFNGSPQQDASDTSVQIQVSQVDPSLRPVLEITYR